MIGSVWIGYDPREDDEFTVAARSVRAHWSGPVHDVRLDDLTAAGLYRRPTVRTDGQLWDTISAAPMATEFAISRFLVPHLARTGWALFMDCDMLVRRPLQALFDLADPSKAVMCVQHAHVPAETIKMDGQIQTAYARKNWSSVMLLNCEHPANRALTVDLVNSVPGRDLHRFCWLEDADIGALPPTWNWLAGYSDPDPDPAIVHFTLGSPRMPGYEHQPFADEWRQILETHHGRSRRTA